MLVLHLKAIPVGVLDLKAPLAKSGSKSSHLLESDPLRAFARGLHPALFTSLSHHVLQRLPTSLKALLLPLQTLLFLTFSVASPGISQVLGSSVLPLGCETLSDSVWSPCSLKPAPCCSPLSQQHRRGLGADPPPRHSCLVSESVRDLVASHLQKRVCCRSLAQS